MNEKKIFTTKPGISITKDGSWHYKKNKIINSKVLEYFKKNLFRDTKGYFIHNQWKNLKEKAYLDFVEASPLNVLSILFDSSQIIIYLDSKEELNVSPKHLVFFAEDYLGVILYKKGEIPARLTSSAMFMLTNYLEKKEKYILRIESKEIEIKEKNIEDYLLFK